MNELCPFDFLQVRLLLAGTR